MRMWFEKKKITLTKFRCKWCTIYFSEMVQKINRIEEKKNVLIPSVIVITFYDWVLDYGPFQPSIPLLS